MMKPEAGIRFRLRVTDLGFPWFCAGAFAAIAACVPLGRIFEIGGDEGFELLKALLCYRGYDLYSEIWNDQPPAHTLLLAGLFQLTGVSVLAARMVALFFGALLIGVFAAWLRRELQMWPAIFGVAVLLSAPWVLTLGTSVMLEMPAFATGLLAAWLLQQRHRAFEPHWLIISAITYALALQIKLTAGVMLPAILVLLLLPPRMPGAVDPSAGRAPRRTIWRPGEKEGRFPPWLHDQGFRLIRCRGLTAGLWITALVSAYALFSRLLGTGGYDLLWASHHAPQMYAALEREGGHAFSISKLGDFPEGVAGSVLGVMVAIRQRRWRRIAFPAVWLVTVLVIHCHHRPWWDYYLLHFVIPMSWLTAEALQLLLSPRRSSEVPGSLTTQWLRYLPMVAAILLASLWVVYGVERPVRDIALLRASRTIQDVPLLGEIQRYAPRVRWMVTCYRPIYAFHAGLPVPPPLAVLPAKRFWSGRLTEAGLLEALQQWRPELLLLENDSPVQGRSPWIRDNFLLVAQDENLLLYVHKTLVADLPQSKASCEGRVLEKRVGYGL